MKGVFLLPIIVWLTAGAQEGIWVEKEWSWPVLLSQAKQCNKFIFVECISKPSASCMRMELIFADQKVVSYFNEHFISVKLDMDSLTANNEFISNCHITETPSFVFIAPNGNVVHKGVGYKSEDELLRLISDALNSHKQYYTLLKNYKNGTLDNLGELNLFNTAILVKDTSMAIRLGEDYISHYLLKLKKSQLYTRESILLMSSVVQMSDSGSKEEAFRLIYHQPRIIDSIIRRNYSRDIIEYVISKEEIDPKLWRSDNIQINENPDWSELIKVVRNKYNWTYADRAILDAKLRWYDYKKDSFSLAQCVIEKIEKYGLDTTGMGKMWVNNMIYYVLLPHCNVMKKLTEAVTWMQEILRSEPRNSAFIDTYANLLYKVGRVNKAIKVEQFALKIDSTATDIQANYQRMKNGDGMPIYK